LFVDHVARCDSEFKGKPLGVRVAFDDAVIEKIIDAASRYCDDATGRRFYPRVETRYFTVPNGCQLWFDDDLLAVTSLLNGEGTAITSGDYNLLPRNEYPKYAVRLTETTSVYWQVDTNSNSEYVISVTGVWGYNELYATRAWKLITTLNEVGILNATDTTFTLTSAAGLDATGGQIIKIDNELMQTKSKAGADLTVEARGENGSTAATHAIASSVYLWMVQPEVVEATLEITNGIYKRRTGENAESSSVLTTGGVIITPRDIPDLARGILMKFARIV